MMTRGMMIGGMVHIVADAASPVLCGRVVGVERDDDDTVVGLLVRTIMPIVNRVTDVEDETCTPLAPPGLTLSSSPMIHHLA